MKHILIIASYGPSLINFRLSLIKKLLSRGHKVSVASPKQNFSDTLQKKIRDLGININFFSLSRTGLNFFKDCKSIVEIYKIIRNSKPNIIISYTAKPVIYTGLVLKYFPKISYYPLITGLGFAFTDINVVKKKIIRYLMIKLYQEALKSAKKTKFQNTDDQSLFLKLKIIKNKNLSNVINGSGVDLSDYPLSNLPSKPVFLMISRLLVDKGVREYVQAAHIVRSYFSNVTFQLAGYLDENPSGITANELQSWINQGDIEYLGEIKSVQSVLKFCRYFVLPSYREGTPRSTLEALSTGRPVITTDVPGCRETVIHEKNGLLIPAKNSVALANAMMKLLKEKDETIEKMARESYLIAKNKYEINKVNQSILKIMNL
ncbi:glycosyltransferase family 4 protein [Candidatus Pelagibacter bacterium]|nr:glycosyltransferase family 4 protein [Candidatus Pelagibacter bacterium]MDA8836198.1 glycosyltransferase family 4 protein [Candidatus Pelagibacter bacterium]